MTTIIDFSGGSGRGRQVSAISGMTASQAQGFLDQNGQILTASQTTTAAAQQAATESAASADWAQQAQAAAYNVPDVAMRDIINNPATETHGALRGYVHDQAIARAPLSMHGFTVQRASMSYVFLAFAPDGAMIARMAQTSGGRRLGRSDDDGATWSLLGEPSPVNIPTAVWFTTAGSWLAFADGSLHRSADDGATWTQVATTGTLLNQGVAQQVDGTLWAVEYLGDARVWRSADDGATWTVVKNFPNTDGGDGAVIRHIHGVMVASDESVWCFTGDNNTQCGLWKWDGADFVRQSPALTDAEGAQRWRAVGVIERDGWFYWVQDGASAAGDVPAIVKAHPSNLAGTMTTLATLPTGGWYIAALPSGDLLAGSVNEGVGKENDRASRLWMVDADDRVTEVWSAAVSSPIPTTFPAVRNLDVRQSDGLVAFSISGVDWTGPTSWATVAGSVVPGMRPLPMSRQTTPRVYPDLGRFVQAVGVVSSPTVTGDGSGNFVDVPDLAIPVSLPTSAPIKATVSMDCRNNTAGQYTNIQLSLINTATGGVSSAVTGIRVGSQIFETVTAAGVLTPPQPGEYIVKVRWNATGSSRGESSWGYRRLIVET